MAQPEQAAEGAVTAEASVEDRIAAAAGIEDEQEENLEPEEGEEPESEDEPEEEAEELPPIEPPSSWTAEDKAKFGELPRETQEIVARRETERDRFVETKAGETQRAKADARREALAQVVEVERQAAEQLQQLSAALLPQRPDPRYLAGNDTDRAFYYQQLAVYEEAVAQQQQLQQQADRRKQQAQQYQQELSAQEAAEFRRELSDKFPEYLDPSTGPQRQQELAAIALELGYPPELIPEARTFDILAMRKAAEWKADSVKYRALQSKKMAGVREAKNLPKVSRPGVSQPKGAVSAERRQAAMDRAKQTRSPEDFAALLEARGFKL